MGRGPKDTHTHLIGDLLLVRLRGVLTAAEQQLARSPPAEKGRNLLKLLRRLALPPGVKHWTLTTLREKLIKTEAKVVRHSKYVRFQLAEVAVPRRLFAAILDRIQGLRPVLGVAPS